MFNDGAALDSAQVVAGITTIGDAGIDADIGWLMSLIIPSASACALVLAVGAIAILAVVRAGDKHTHSKNASKNVMEL